MERSNRDWGNRGRGGTQKVMDHGDPMTQSGAKVRAFPIAKKIIAEKTGDTTRSR